MVQVAVAAHPGHDAAAETPSLPRTQGQKINVLYLTTGLGIGGAEIVVRDLVRRLDSERFSVSVVCIKALGAIGHELKAEGVDISVLETQPDRPDYFAAFKLRKLVREMQIDVVHSHTTHSLTVAAMCRCITPGLKAVHTFHFGNYPHRPSKVLWMEHIGARLVDQLVAVGQVQEEQVKDTYNLKDSAIRTVHNGVYLPTSNTGDPGFRSRVGADGKLLVGTIATLIPQKGLHDLLAVARQVRDVRDDVRFVVVGEGILREELERKRRDLGLDDTVTFTGWVSNAASLALPSFDVYFQPSHWEAMSISILEAMAASKPVVSTLVGEAPHLIENGTEGFLCQPRDIAAMASAILRLSGDDRLRKSTGDAAARKVGGRFTVGHMARAYERLYQDVLRRDGSVVRASD